MFDFIFNHKREVLTLAAEHLWLVGTSMVLAIAIGVPLGIFLTRRPAWKNLVLGTNSVIQTIPSQHAYGIGAHGPPRGYSHAARATAARKRFLPQS